MIYTIRSLWNLEPSCSVMLFKTYCDNWEPERYKEKLPRFDESWHAIAEDENLLVVLAVQTTSVRWGNYKDLKDTNYKILIAHWDQSRSALFVFSNDYKAFRVENLVSTICDDKFEIVSGEKVFNVFNGIEYPLARNLGASQIGAISFTQYFGPNVTEGLSLIEASQSSLSNIAALGYESGNRVIWGCSQRRGKVWSPQKGVALLIGATGLRKLGTKSLVLNQIQTTLRVTFCVLSHYSNPIMNIQYQLNGVSICLLRSKIKLFFILMLYQLTYI
ncbi:hypothetical protein OHD37_06300 [Escherichia coli]|nr:hypothetical protein [Escherichia coli]